jgi:hypothetical protein
MHVQYKSVTPPEGYNDENILFIQSKDIIITKHQGSWVYEPKDKTNTSISLPHELHAEATEANVYVHDTEGWNNRFARIICSRTGRPLAPYFVADKTKSVSIDNASFSIAVPFTRIEFCASMFFLKIHEVNTEIIKNKGEVVAQAVVKSLFEGPVKISELYCKTCMSEIALGEVDFHNSSSHDISVSKFASLDKFPQYERAIRAAYKKALFKINRASFIDKRKK